MCILSKKKPSNIIAEYSAHPFGYKLGDEIIFIIDDKVLFNFGKKEEAQRIQLRTTMANLLTYLLRNANKEIILDNELMSMVWEANGLRASSHRLWQVMRDLRYKLLEIGLMVEIFFRVENKGYSVNNNNILPFYRISNITK